MYNMINDGHRFCFLQTYLCDEKIEEKRGESEATVCILGLCKANWIGLE